MTVLSNDITSHRQAYESKVSKKPFLNTSLAVHRVLSSRHEDRKAIRSHDRNLLPYLEDSECIKEV
jgi:hypothetical protein